MPELNLAEIKLTAKLSPAYIREGFRLYEENDHILVLEHQPCGFQDKFFAPSTRITAIENDCADHLTRCPCVFEEGE